LLFSAAAAPTFFFPVAVLEEVSDAVLDRLLDAPPLRSRSEEIEPAGCDDRCGVFLTNNPSNVDFLASAPDASRKSAATVVAGAAILIFMLRFVLLAHARDL
jgi:hypothetical protein